MVSGAVPPIFKDEIMCSRLLKQSPLNALVASLALLAFAAPASQAQVLPWRRPSPPCLPVTPCPAATVPQPGQLQPPSQEPSPPRPEPQPAAEPILGAEQAAATGTGQVALAAPTMNNLAGYIDNAIPMTQVRLRFDAAYDDNRPDRAEFFYAKCGCFKPSGVRAPGPPLAETSVDYQDLSTYVEGALSNRFSAFVEVNI